MKLARPIKDNEVRWLKKNYPDLNLSANCLIIKGQLNLSMVYDESKEGYILFPSEEQRCHGVWIKDRYEIEIDLSSSSNGILPIVKETAGRIKKVAEARGKPLADFHFTVRESACLCFEFEKQKYLSNGFDLQTFFEKLLVPFFFGQSYMETYGKWPPWGEYAHNALAYFEW